MDSFEIGELVVVRVYADTEEQAGIAAVHDLMIPELAQPHASAFSYVKTQRTTHLDKVRLVLLVPRCHQPVDLSPQPHLSPTHVSGPGPERATHIEGSGPSRHRHRERTIWKGVSSLDDSVTSA